MTKQEMAIYVVDTLYANHLPGRSSQITADHFKVKSLMRLKKDHLQEKYEMAQKARAAIN